MHEAKARLPYDRYDRSDHSDHMETRAIIPSWLLMETTLQRSQLSQHIAATTIAEIEKVLSQRSLSLRSLESGFHMIAMIAAIAELCFSQRSQRSQRSYGHRAQTRFNFFVYARFMHCRYFILARTQSRKNYAEVEIDLPQEQQWVMNPATRIVGSASRVSRAASRCCIFMSNSLV